MKQRQKNNRGLLGLFDFLKEALRAEGTTPTGRINLTSIVLLTACVIVILPVKGVEVIVAGLLTYFNKPVPELIPAPILYALGFGTIIFFFICLWVVRDMELKKDEIRNQD